jgi:hypothetical protein
MREELLSDQVMQTVALDFLAIIAQIYSVTG